MPNSSQNQGKPTIVKTRPAVFMPVDEKTTKMIAERDTEIRLLLSEGLMSIHELAEVVNIMPAYHLFLTFGLLMHSTSWRKSVMCKLIIGDQGVGLNIIASDAFAQADFHGEVYVPACWGDTVIHLANQGVRSVAFENGRHVASFFHPKPRCILHLKSNPCHFDLTKTQYVEEKVAA